MWFVTFIEKKNDLFRDNSTNQLFCNPYKIYKIELLFYLGLSFMVIFLIKPFPIFYFFWINLIMDLSITRLKTDKNNNKMGLMSQQLITDKKAVTLTYIVILN